LFFDCFTNQHSVHFVNAVKWIYKKDTFCAINIRSIGDIFSDKKKEKNLELEEKKEGEHTPSFFFFAHF
jgi:hypothetical protein